ncbi:MAG TPA: hypothetical protein VLF66_09705 [Thermoanaerobaculia bacterium]|nr:hypothetical protein [Thermoanaerobaculia bacterium]
MEMLASLRQRTFPRELRIDRPAWPSEVLAALRELASGGSGPNGPPPGDGAGDEERAAFLAPLATALWRLRQRLVDPETGKPREEARRALRQLESTWDVLTEQGVEIQDHTGEPVPERGTYGLKALAYEPTPGLARDTVVETVKPSVFHRGRMIQMGEVIVGTPERPGSASPAGPAA